MKDIKSLNLICQYSFFNSIFVLLEPSLQDQGGTRSLPKWQIVGSAASKPLQRPVASLKPGSAPQKATLLTQNGPVDVSTDLSYLLTTTQWGQSFYPRKGQIISKGLFRTLGSVISNVMRKN